MSLSPFVQLLTFSTSLLALTLLSKMVFQRESTGIIETGLTLLYQSHIPLNYWSYAFSATTYLINRMPSSVLGFHSPWEKVYSKPPALHTLKAFGYACYLDLNLVHF